MRTLDERMVGLQRQGRIGFYGSCTGQEAVSAAVAEALRPTDWVVPALREQGILLARGYPLEMLVAQLFGNVADPSRGRQMPCHAASGKLRFVSWSSCIGSQLPHAVGLAWGAQVQRRDEVVVAMLGDGATSTGDFHASMTFAAVRRVPCVFVCQNNGWAISMPANRQTAVSIAAKGEAYGIPAEQTDGNDASALMRVLARAVDRARSGQGPTLIEALTYRMGAHSSSDDPSRYRDAAEVASWAERDPIDRCVAELCAQGLPGAELRSEAAREMEAEIAAALEEVERLGAPPLDTLFEDVYAALPWHLREQSADVEAATSMAVTHPTGSPARVRR